MEKRKPYKSIKLSHQIVLRNESGDVCSMFGSCPPGYSAHKTGKISAIWVRYNGEYGVGFGRKPYNTKEEAIEHCSKLTDNLEIEGV